MGDVIQFPRKKTPKIPPEATALVIRADRHLAEAERLMALANKIADDAGVPKAVRRVKG